MLEKAGHIVALALYYLWSGMVIGRLMDLFVDKIVKPDDPKIGQYIPFSLLLVVFLFGFRQLLSRKNDDETWLTSLFAKSVIAFLVITIGGFSVVTAYAVLYPLLFRR